MSSHDQYRGAAYGQPSYGSVPFNSLSGNNYYKGNASAGTAGLDQTTQIWMGDLDPWWDEAAIKQIWASIGEGDQLTQVKLIFNRNMPSMTTPAPGAKIPNSGYCFLTFGSYQLAQLALSHNGMGIPGTKKAFKLNWASSNQQQLPQQQLPQQLLPQQSHSHYSLHSMGNGNLNQPQEFSIFVGDLLPDVSEKLLFEFFKSQYPSCSNAKIMIDQVTGNSRGYGFVKFTTQLDQSKALLEMQSAILNGRPIRVSTAMKNSQSSQFRSGTPDLLQSQQSMLQQQSKVTIPAQFNPPFNPVTDSNNTTIFIGGLNVPISAEELRSYFITYGEIVYVKVLDGKNCGFVQYVHRSDAERAMLEMQGFPVGTSRLRLAWGQKYSQHQQPQQSQTPSQTPSQLPQQPNEHQTLYSSLLGHSMSNSNFPISNGFLDDNTYINGNYNFGNDLNSLGQQPHMGLQLPGNSNNGANYSNMEYFNLKDLMLNNQLNSFQ